MNLEKYLSNEFMSIALLESYFCVIWTVKRTKYTEWFILFTMELTLAYLNEDLRRGASANWNPRNLELFSMIRSRESEPIRVGDFNITLKTCLNFRVRWPVLRRTLYVRVQIWSNTVFVRLIVSKSKSSRAFWDAKCSFFVWICSKAIIPRKIIPTRP